MRLAAFILVLLLAPSVGAQDAPPKKKKKPATTKEQPAKQTAGRAKPTPEQLRKFNELQKKQP